MFKPILVSACLLGLPTRYDGKHKENSQVLTHLKEKGLHPIPVCPEQLAGLATPRPKCWFDQGDGKEVLLGKGRLVRSDGKEMNSHFIRGAEVTLQIARLTDCQTALFKEGSPSCGVGRVYRQQQSVAGQGVATAMLQHNGLRVYSEEDI
ncbi:hypothetical protein A7E78_01650 [Syntrophotalea acetylenivorans]|uniref:Uncharacterized protein n=1 Tax=Syntrophotalea acetylenivorans TaxID=1842532 RepID=A0A1L3GLX3_9BACT|nr:DUF523 domain-containing protein [Syntrophotalea acetylenivorans]APG26678.1 hypothetical protein A7E78_01650 [Syntrophotalea acetylenivorans]